jgi:cell division protease FtsH
MSENNKNSDEEKNDKRGGEFRFNSRTVALWITIVGAFAVLMLLKNTNVVQPQELTVVELLKRVNEDRVVDGKITYSQQSNIQTITGKLIKVDEKGEKIIGKDGKPETTDFRTQDVLTESYRDKLIESGKFKPYEPSTFWVGFVYSLLPLLIIVALIYFFLIRQIKMAGKGAMSFGKSKARMMAKDKNKLTFKDVAGVEEAKEEVSELVDFLKDPKKFQKLGGRIPKGILMVGPPGTGKTLLAKAIAGEADAAFFSISGSDFVEMFVGVGASRVRDMFDQARKNTPCLIFIDEIDAVGRSRGHGFGGGNDEREQTLNALLVEMDGFDTQEGIIIIAATNRPDVLDPALLRPGRFDRQINVSLPDVRGREAILKVHAKNVKLDPIADLSLIARGTPGYSGADLANLLNEAALLAARTGKKAITQGDLEEARVKVRWGRERRSMAMSDENKKLTAWHEAGHALVNVLLKHTHPLHKVTIIPRGQSLGSTWSLPKEDQLNYGRLQMLDEISMAMAGRIAEEIVSGDISTGASGDIQMATQLARNMVCQWGMSDIVGMVQFGSDNDNVFLGRDFAAKKDYSEQTAQKIDEEVRRLITEAYQRSKDLIDTHRDKLEMIANALLEYETLDGAQVEDIIRTGTFTPPPHHPRDVDPPSGAQAATVGNEPVKPAPPILPGLGNASPAPA